MIIRKLQKMPHLPRHCTNFSSIAKPSSSLEHPSNVHMRICELLNELQPRENIIIQGWIRRAQRYGKMLFLKLNDGSSSHVIQAVVPRSLCHTASPGSAIQLRGRWLPSIGPEQSMEFLAEECNLIGTPEEECRLPEGDNDALRKNPHLRPKNLAFSAILRMRSRITHLTHRFFEENAFVHVDTPILSENDCEGAGEAFSVNHEKEFFENTQAFLPVSAQLHLEAISSAITRVYTLSPAFRANKSITQQHMAEFRMLEAECSFVDNLDDIITVVEEYLRFLLKTIDTDFTDDFNSSAGLCKRNGENFDSQILTKCLSGRLDEPLPRITFLDALKTLGYPTDNTNRALNKNDEMKLVNEFQGPVFITHFPSAQKAFYMRRTDDGQFTESFDLLAPFCGELAGGSVREWDPELLASRIPDATKAKLKWYLDLRRWGYPRSSGFGLGMDRLMQSLFGIVNVKDTIAFPRCHKLAIKC